MNLKVSIREADTMTTKSSLTILFENPFWIGLYEQLKSIRKQAGMSQEQLAEKLGVSRQVDNEVK